MNIILEMKGVTKRYPGFELQSVDLTLERGYIMGFIGPNGAGKSTTIKLIMNLIRKDSGEIRIFGMDHQRDEIAIKQKIGFVYDENHYYEELTAEEMKNIIRPFYKQWDEALFKKYARDLALPLNKPIKQLSKGMKMKFALIVALSHHAELLIMDEPTSGLDPVIRSELLDILRDVMQDEEKSIFFSTHITSDLDKVADYITFIHHGRIVFTHAKDELLEQYRIVKGDKRNLHRHRSLFISVREHDYGYAALTDNGPEVKRQLGDSVIMEKPTIEDIMLYTIRKDELRDVYID